MKPIYFSSPEEFRQWLTKHHASADELQVGYYKAHTGKPSMTWPQSVDEALCFGWIDGVRRSVDEERYTIRFTPRKKKSHWSAVNLKRAKVLIDEGKMTPAGLAVFTGRDEKAVGRYSSEQAAVELPKEMETQFKKNKPAWTWWNKQPPGYRKTASWWVISAMREDTRQKRLNQLVEDCALGVRVKPLRPPGS